MRRAAKIDANHKAIVEALEVNGWRVLSLARVGQGCPDLLVYRGCQMRLIEVKSDKGKLTPDQEDFHRCWPVKILRSVDEALAL